MKGSDMIKIEVTGSTLGEVSDKLLSIGARLRNAAPVEAAPEAKVLQGRNDSAPVEETKPKRAPRKKAEEPVEATPVAEETKAPEIVEEEPELPMEEPKAEEPDAPKPLEFDTDIAPRVIAFTVANGREKMAALMDQFGVERASQIPPARWPELIELLEG
jgi:hypothetical protein